MKQSGIRWSLASAMLFALAAGARADHVLYRGESLTTGAIRLAGWGSGVAVDDPVRGYEAGGHSVRMSVDGYYSGGRVIFTNPMNITDDVTNPNAFLELVMQFQPGQIKALAATAAAALPGPGGSGGNSGAMLSGGGNSGGGGPSPLPGGGGDTGQGTTPDTRFLRVVMLFDGGQAISWEQPLVMLPTSEQGWVRIAIPFTKFRSTARLPRYVLRELRIFGDSPDTFNVGTIRTVTDSDPIVVEPLDEQVVAVGDQVTFTATAEAGLSILKYSWNFGDSGDTLEDALGRRVTHVFKRPSPENKPYTVTLTVTDLGGTKPPQTITTTVEVIE